MSGQAQGACSAIDDINNTILNQLPSFYDCPGSSVPPLLHDTCSDTTGAPNLLPFPGPVSLHDYMSCDSILPNEAALPGTGNPGECATEQEIQSALGYKDGKLTEQRSDALDRYYGKKYGNEQEGRSQIVTRDVADVIEWIMPSLMKIFTSGDQVVKFEPQGPEDVEMAKESTDYVYYVFMRQNPGFHTIYQWFKDALLQKNGVIKHYWDDSSETLREAVSYTHLTLPTILLV